MIKLHIRTCMHAPILLTISLAKDYSSPWHTWHSGASKTKFNFANRYTR